MHRNKIIIIFLVALILLVAALAYFKKEPAPPVVNDPQETGLNPENPSFIMGSVTTVNADRAEFVVNGTTYFATISAETELLKQVQDPATGVISQAPATASDFKAGDMVVVYYKGALENNTYDAYTIQKISL